MSAYDLVFVNPSLDANHPIGGAVLVNASPDDLAVVLAIELTRDPQIANVSAVLRGLDTSEKAQEHIVALAAPATVLRTTIAVRLTAMEDGKPRPLIVETLSPGAVCTVRVLSAIPI